MQFLSDPSPKPRVPSPEPRAPSPEPRIPNPDCPAAAKMTLMSVSRTAAIIIFGAVVAAAAQEGRVPATAELQRMAARFVPTEINADVSHLSPNDRRVLAKLVEASKMIDALFLRQVWSGNDAMLLELIADETPEGRARLH